MVVMLFNNISVGGVGIIDEKKLLFIILGVMYEDCQLELGDNILVLVKLQVCDCKEFKMINGKVVNCFGCQFIDILCIVLVVI